MNQQIKSKRYPKLIAALVIIGSVAGAAYWLSTSAKLRMALAKWIQPAANSGEAAPADPHAGHDHGGHDHGGGSTDFLEVSETGLKNIGYRPVTVATTDFQEKLVLPATVAERPGYSQTQIPAPMTGIITRIYQSNGSAVEPGSPLFDMRLTHEELVTAQQNFLRSAESMDVITREIKRLEAIGEGTLAGKRILEQQYEKQKLEAAYKAEYQSLLLHGLNDEQIQNIQKNRELLKTLTVYAPKTIGKNNPAVSPKFHLQDMPVKLGQQVEAGQAIAVIANHTTLYLEGRAFENDMQKLQKTIANGWKVKARPNGATEDSQLIGDLEVVYLSDHIDPETRAITFYLTLKNSVVSEREIDGNKFIEWKYRPGQRMELLIPTEQWPEKIVLPIDSVVVDGVENYVFVQNGNKFERVAVHVEYRDLQNAVIENNGNLFDGTIVAGKGAYQMQLALKNKAGGGIDPHAGHNH